MKPFITHTGLVLPFDRVNVDTDQMVPKQFLKALTREGFGRILFYDWRYLAGEKPNPEFILNFPEYKGASILLTRANFGCGSSREHAPWALQQYGFKAIIAPSFADIFFNNCFKNGLLPIVLTELEVDHLFNEATAHAPMKLTVDLPAQSVTAGSRSFHFDIDATRKTNLVNGWDEIGLTLRHADEIKAYQEERKKTEPWIFQ